MANSANKKLSAAINLANLLPTGTALAFQTLLPNFTNNGSCLPSHKCLTLLSIIGFTLVCFFSCFTDSFIAGNGKLYYGIAISKGFYIFNKDENSDNNKNGTEPNKIEEGNQAQHNKEGEINHDEERGQQASTQNKEILSKENLEEYQIQHRDYLHAVSSSLVFFVFAICSSDVQRCFLPHPSDDIKALMMNLPLAVGVVASLVFMLFPTKRRGIGFADPPITLKK